VLDTVLDTVLEPDLLAVVETELDAELVPVLVTVVPSQSLKSPEINAVVILFTFAATALQSPGLYI